MSSDILHDRITSVSYPVDYSLQGRMSSDIDRITNASYPVDYLVRRASSDIDRITSVSYPVDYLVRRMKSESGSPVLFPREAARVVVVNPNTTIVT